MTRRLATFLVVGAMNSLFGYGMFAFFIFAGLHYSLAVMLGTVLGVLFNFKTTGRLVFKSHDNRLIFRFVGVYVVNYLLTVAALRLLDGLRINMYGAGLIVTAPMALISYLLLSRFVFVEKTVHAAH
jgi:putative flippase GtrA